MIANFFIDRPVLANVIAWITLLLGAVSMLALPVSQYPSLTPPTIQVSASYPGASATTVQQLVARTIEQEVNGVEGMIYMSSTSSNDGRYALTVSFAVGTDPNQAQVAVQNRVSAALASLPDSVQQQGVVTKTKSTAILQIVALTSTDPSHDSLFLSNYASLQLRDRLARLPGVSDASVFGVGKYSMRVWLDAEQMRSRGLDPASVTSIISKQSLPGSVGQLGAPPMARGQAQQITVNLDSELLDAESFGDLILKTDSKGALTRLKDVARLELGSQNYGQSFSFNGTPSAGVAIYQLPGANALETAQAVRDEMERLSVNFPKAITHNIAFDTTVFVDESINEVYKTLFEAGLLVLIVIVVFLQDWRSTLVPATTVPITIIGAFAAMAALGFSINILTLLALVLCIGIVVDDAIVVVEGVAKQVDAGLTPREAARSAMSELMAPIIGITLVLMAVFLPAAFIPGITGQMYRQFALVIAATALISGINAITLKPTQSAKYVRAHDPSKRKNVFFRLFDRVYEPVERRYARLIKSFVAHTKLSAFVAVALIVIGLVGLIRLPTAFIPTEDQGYLIVSVQLPDAASLQRTETALKKITDIARATPGVSDVIAIGGVSVIDGNAPLANSGLLYLILDDWAEREGKPGEDLKSLYEKLTKDFSTDPSFSVRVLAPPPIPGLGQSGGFQMQLVQTDASNNFAELGAAADSLVAAAQARPEILLAFTPVQMNTPQIRIVIERSRAELLGVSVNDAMDAVQSYLGSSYAGQFNKFGQNYGIYVQADEQFRGTAEQVSALTVRSTRGGMVPLGSFIRFEDMVGPSLVSQYNLFPTATINGASTPQYSSGEVLTLMEELAEQTLPEGITYEWTGLSYQEKIVGNSVALVFALAIVLVYLVLAGQYESWLSPIPVILAVPMSLVGTVLALSLLNVPNNLYVQIGLVLLIALSAKNAILIVEVAQELRHSGMAIVEAALEGSKRRFRPILMTSFAFILGVVPLVLATGAGASARKSIGIAVFSGMLASTLLAVAFVPVFYVIIETWKSRGAK